MAHIFPHWNWPERVGQVTPVHVYTSGDEAELFVNGTSAGRQKKEPFKYRLVWDKVEYQPGELKVVTYKGGKEWAKDEVKTTGPAAKLLLSADRAGIRADGMDLSYVTVVVADKDGLMVPRTHNLITFSISGLAMWWRWGMAMRRATSRTRPCSARRSTGCAWRSSGARPARPGR